MDFGLITQAGGDTLRDIDVRARSRTPGSSTVDVVPNCQARLLRKLEVHSVFSDAMVRRLAKPRRIVTVLEVLDLVADMRFLILEILVIGRRRLTEGGVGGQLLDRGVPYLM